MAGHGAGHAPALMQVSGKLISRLNPTMKLVDTHLHLWNPEKFHYPWLADFPTLQHRFGFDDYLAAAGGAEIVRAVFVECDVECERAFDEARGIQKLAGEHPLIAGLVASARPELPGFDAQIDALLEFPNLRGIRRALHVVPDDVSQSSRFLSNVRSLAAHGLTFDICMLARQLPLAAAIVTKCPDVQFVLDHCGVPDVKGKAFDPWRADLARIAKLPNLVCKVSGLVAYASAGWTTEELRPWFEHAVECFGWERLMWGSDWPVCTLGGTLLDWLEATRELLQSASPDERDRICWRNAETIYRLC
jgi:predicted TIM-barrel fold metal-dependent hydrolase